MQDIHSFESTAGGGDRRLRHHHHQDTNCPRCDSSNTKFCYYNNYNLSQPRHFCKSCRRYWTKGGVLRNVPVGGGIRKAKRSNKSKSKTSIPSSDAVAAQRKSSNSENSSSDSSSLTANTTTRITTATTTPITATDVSGSNSTNSTSAVMLNFNDSSRRFFNIPQSSIPITTVDPLMLSQSSAGKMSSEIGTFTSLMASSTDQLSGIPSIQLQQQNTEHTVENQNPYQLQWTAETTGLMDQTAEIELSRYGSRRSNGGLAGAEGWEEITDEGLFDLTGNVDQSYWSQSQWNDEDHDPNYIP